MSHYVGDCPNCKGSGDAPVSGVSSNISMLGNCGLCSGLGVVRVALSAVPLVRRREDGTWERVEDAVSRLGSVAGDEAG